ncbi:hypothetical protein [Grimontia hollisae]|uniref:hypothetical protein n=1 Tax=Grimontia hollisae TaxID=673 RepID=UPI0012ACEAB8|nr:hypothetical protein [Grimontia hollisae]
MKVFPAPPTDNLYKFMAITGSWLMALVVVLFMFIGYINHDLERATVQQQSYMNSLKALRGIELREESIRNGDLTENILPWVPVSDGSNRELEYLNDRKEEHQKYISNVEENQIDYGRWFDLVEATGAMWFIYGIVAIGWSCFYFGFRGWYTKVQKHADETVLLEKTIKELTIKQIEQEMSIAKKASMKRFSRNS